MILEYKYITTYKGYDILLKNNIYNISKHNKILYGYFTELKEVKEFINDILEN